MLWPARTTAMGQIFLMPMLAVSVAVLARPVPVEMLPVMFFAAWLGALLGTRPFDRTVFPGMTFQEWLHDVAVAWLLRFGIWFVWIAAMLLMPLEFGWPMILLIFSVVLVQVGWGRMALAVLRALGTLTRPDEQLSRIVAETSADAGVRVRGVWGAGGRTVNALALPLSGELIFTRRLLEVMSDEELRAVCAHELGHLGESRGVKAGRLVGSFAALPLLLIRPVGELAGLPGMALLFCLMGLLKKHAIRNSQRMEKRADGIASLTETTPGVYARALEKIYEGNHIPAVMPGTRMPHPHLYERMLDAGVAPDFPRPQPPAKRCWHGWLLLALVPVMAFWAALTHINRTSETVWADDAQFDEGSSSADR